jgi:competence protein ComGC
MTKNTDLAGDKSCDATRKLFRHKCPLMKVEHGQLPRSLDTLVQEGYVDQVTCASGKTLRLDGKNVIIVSG